jgi:phosphoglycolate phosphatase-like HAD superfamily hydrolase
MKVWLFDLDGVLIRPAGYREALRRTVGYFSQEAGYAERGFQESTIEAFEARGVTCEWDIAGICLMADIFAVWKANPALHLPPDLSDCLRTIRTAGLAHPEPDYAFWARRVGSAGGDTPSASAIKLFRQEAGHIEGNSARVEEWETILGLVLGHPREFLRSPVMQYFQQFTLGSRTYADFYHTQPVLETPSLLAELDQAALSPAARDRVLEQQRKGRIHAAIITARPCRPPSPKDDLADYPPEAEIAQKIAGFETLPLAGAGHMQWLARRHQQAVDAYLKPSPVHSLTALAFALAGVGETSLEAARLFVEERKPMPPLDRLIAEKAEILVLEDSPTGVISTQSAVDLLTRKGADIRLSFIGVASGGEKQAALEALGAEVFASTERAVEAALASRS